MIDNYCMTEKCRRKRRKDENMCTTCTIAALRFELIKAQKEIADYRLVLLYYIGLDGLHIRQKFKACRARQVLQKYGGKL